VARLQPLTGAVAGRAVADALDLDLDEADGKGRAAEVLKALLAAGWLKNEEGRDEKRRPRTFVVAGKRPDELRLSQQVDDADVEDWEW
jgi:chromosome segregation and condensation protein ScpB